MWIFKVLLQCSWCLHSSLMWLHATRQLISTILRHHSGLICKGPQRINCFFDIPTLENDTTMFSQNVTASKSMPHPRLKTSFSLKFALLHLSNNYIPSPTTQVYLTLVTAPYFSSMLQLQPYTNCSAHFPLGLYSNQPLYTGSFKKIWMI
jgi:hypothetical protein